MFECVQNEGPQWVFKNPHGYSLKNIANAFSNAFTLPDRQFKEAEVGDGDDDGRWGRDCDGVLSHHPFYLVIGVAFFVLVRFFS